jgi:hypothetical protein
MLAQVRGVAAAGSQGQQATARRGGQVVGQTVVIGGHQVVSPPRLGAGPYRVGHQGVSWPVLAASGMDHPSLAHQPGVLSTAGSASRVTFVKSVNLAVV